MALEAAPWLISHGCQVVYLGAGEKGLEDWMRVRGYGDGAG